MDRPEIETFNSELRRRIRRFLSNKAEFRRPLSVILRSMSESKQPVFFFGGLLKDLMVLGPAATPRDVDIVVSSVTEEMTSLWATQVKRRTRFGGVHLDSKGWLVDVWQVSDTWAFKQGFFHGCSFEDLPKTTFLNIQAVVAEVNPRPGKGRRIYSKGFFEAIKSRTIDINFEENPYPSLCVLVALLTAAKLSFSMSSRLARYVLYHTRTLELDEFLEIQRSHYGRIYCDLDKLYYWIAAIRDQVRSAARRPVSLPKKEYRQFLLPLNMVVPQNLLCGSDDECDLRANVLGKCARQPIKSCRAGKHFSGSLPGLWV